MLNQLLSPVFYYVARPINYYLKPESKTKPKTEAEIEANNKLVEAKTTIQLQAIQNPVFRDSLLELSKDLDTFDKSTHDLLLLGGDKKIFFSLISSIYQLVEDDVLPLVVKANKLINESPGNKNHLIINLEAESIDQRYQEIKGKVNALKTLSTQFPPLWKDTAWKNLILIVGVSALILSGFSVGWFTVGVGAAWLLYEAYYNNRKDLFEKAAKSLDPFKTLAEEKNSAIIKLNIKSANERAESAYAKAEEVVGIMNTLIQTDTAMEKRLEYLERQRIAARSTKAEVIKAMK